MKLNTTNLREIKLGTPIIAPGIYFARIMKATVNPNKANTGTNLDLELQLHGEEVPLNAGGMVKNTGFRLFRTVSMVPTEKYDPNKSYKELSVAIKLGEDEDLELDALQNKDVKIKVKYVEAQGSYGEKNDIVGFLPIKDADSFNPSF